MAKRSFDDFDEYAKDYRSIHTDNVKLSGADSFYFAEHKVKALQRSETDGPVALLDIGCGDGVTEAFIHKYFPGWEVEGIDVSEQSILKAKEKQIPRTNFTVYNGSAIPFGESSFDIVFIAAVLHHIDFKFHRALIGEIYRVLKPGGRLYLFEHNPVNPVTRYLVNTCVFDEDAKLLGYPYTGKLLKKALFRDIELRFMLFFPRKGILARLVRFEDKLGWLPLGGQYMYKAQK